MLTFLVYYFARPVWIHTPPNRGKKLPTARTFFVVRATKKIKKTVLDQKIPQKNYRSGKCWLGVFEFLTNKVFFKKKIKSKYTWNTKKFQHLPLSFYSTAFECFKTVFTFIVAPSKKKCAHSEVFFPYWVVWIHTGLVKY